MSANEVLLPPWVIPQGESSTLVDDSTSVFRAAYAPGNAQRVAYVDPRLQVKQTFQGLRSFERGAMLAAMKRAGGKFGTVRAIVGYRNRGSFPQTELFANNDFTSGSSSWGSDGTYSLLGLDHGARATRASSTSPSSFLTQSIAVTSGVPYFARYFLNAGKSAIASIFLADFSSGGSAFGNVLSNGQGFLFGPYTAPATGSRSLGLNDNMAGTFGSYVDVKWSSFAQCALVDNGVNLLLNSDGIGGTSWTNSNLTVAAGGGTNPDGSAGALNLSETATATVQHKAAQFVTVPAAAADYSFSVFVHAGNRTWCLVQIGESTGGTFLSTYLNLSTGAFGTASAGANWTSISQAAVNYGNGWWRVILTGRKTNAATTLQAIVSPATADNGGVYTGSTTPAAINAWRASLAQSSVPVQPIQTTTVAITGTNQTGNSLNLKGLPVSSSGLLLEDDLFEINAELKGAISPLSSDAAGLGTVFFAPSLCRSPSDGDGVIINKPMGKFILAADSNWTNNYGVYADSDITLEAINE